MINKVEILQTFEVHGINNLTQHHEKYYMFMYKNITWQICIFIY